MHAYTKLLTLITSIVVLSFLLLYGNESGHITISRSNSEYQMDLITYNYTNSIHTLPELNNTISIHLSKLHYVKVKVFESSRGVVLEWNFQDSINNYLAIDGFRGIKLVAFGSMEEIKIQYMFNVTSRNDDVTVDVKEQIIGDIHLFASFESNYFPLLEVQKNNFGDSEQFSITLDSNLKNSGSRDIFSIANNDLINFQLHDSNSTIANQKMETVVSKQILAEVDCEMDCQSPTGAGCYTEAEINASTGSVYIITELQNCPGGVVINTNKSIEIQNTCICSDNVIEFHITRNTTEPTSSIAVSGGGIVANKVTLVVDHNGIDTDAISIVNSKIISTVDNITLISNNSPFRGIYLAEGVTLSAGQKLNIHTMNCGVGMQINKDITFGTIDLFESYNSNISVQFMGATRDVIFNSWVSENVGELLDIRDVNNPGIMVEFRSFFHNYNQGMPSIHCYMSDITFASSLSGLVNIFTDINLLECDFTFENEFNMKMHDGYITESSLVNVDHFQVSTSEIPSLFTTTNRFSEVELINGQLEIFGNITLSKIRFSNSNLHIKDDSYVVQFENEFDFDSNAVISVGHNATLQLSNVNARAMIAITVSFSITHSNLFIYGNLMVANDITIDLTINQMNYVDYHCFGVIRGRFANDLISIDSVNPVQFQNKLDMELANGFLLEINIDAPSTLFTNFSIVAPNKDLILEVSDHFYTNFSRIEANNIAFNGATIIFEYTLWKIQEDKTLEIEASVAAHFDFYYFSISDGSTLQINSPVMNLNNFLSNFTNTNIIFTAQGLIEGNFTDIPFANNELTFKSIGNVQISTIFANHSLLNLDCNTISITYGVVDQITVKNIMITIRDSELETNSIVAAIDDTTLKLSNTTIQSNSIDNFLNVTLVGESLFDFYPCLPNPCGANIATIFDIQYGSKLRGENVTISTNTFNFRDVDHVDAILFDHLELNVHQGYLHTNNLPKETNILLAGSSMNEFQVVAKNSSDAALQIFSFVSDVILQCGTIDVDLLLIEAPIELQISLSSTEQFIDAIYGGVSVNDIKIFANEQSIQFQPSYDLIQFQNVSSQIDIMNMAQRESIDMYSIHDGSIIDLDDPYYFLTPDSYILQLKADVPLAIDNFFYNLTDTDVAVGQVCLSLDDYILSNIQHDIGFNDIICDDVDWDITCDWDNRIFCIFDLTASNVVQEDPFFRYILIDNLDIPSEISVFTFDYDNDVVFESSTTSTSTSSLTSTFSPTSTSSPTSTQSFNIPTFFSSPTTNPTGTVTNTVVPVDISNNPVPVTNSPTVLLPSKTQVPLGSAEPPVPPPTHSPLPSVSSFNIGFLPSLSPSQIPINNCETSFNENCDSIVPIQSNFVQHPSANSIITVFSQTDDNPIITINFDASQSQTSNLIITSPLHVGDIPNLDRVSNSIIVSLTLVDQFGNLLQPNGDVEICFYIDQNENRNYDNDCLGYLDESTKPPSWKCEDQCLTKNDDKNKICGDTDHFTNFALLLNGASSSVSCSNENNYIFDASWKDGVLIGSVAFFIIAMLLIIAFLFSVTPQGKKVLLGDEGYRIYKVRSYNSEDI